MFGHLTHWGIENAWAASLARAKLADPQPVIHNLRHTHVSGLIAAGWDPVEVAQRIGDTLATTLKVYAHEFDSRRRSAQRRRALEARYGSGMATDGAQQTAAAASGETAEALICRQFVTSGNTPQQQGHKFLMFQLRRPDVLAVGDLGIRKAAMQLYGLPEMPGPAEIEEIAEPWRPYRTIACLFLWKTLDAVPV